MTVEFFLVTAVFTVNVVDVAPPAAFTLAGTGASDAFELLSATTAPPLGAAADRVTVPVTGLPPTMLGLSNVNVASVGGGGGGAGFTVTVVVLVTPAYEADSVTEVVAVTDDVVMPKVAELPPCGTVTLAGTATALLALDSETFVPPAGAADVSVIVPVDDVPPVT